MDEYIDDKVIEKISSEIADDYSDDSLFNITSWGADLSFRELISMYEENELVKPELQRNYVWDKTEASRFIESILMGLPVPSIFLAQVDGHKLIVDGYQRIMTVYDYVRGIFSGDKKIFKLSISEKINKRWRGKAFKELTSEEQRKIRSTTIHAIIFEQKHPKNGDTSLFQVFERINTSGRTLTSQEIRNCVYQGSLNTMLFQINNNPTWRILFGTAEPDTRMRDLEYILRFFVIISDAVQNASSKQISLKKELNDFMEEHKSAPEKQIQDYTNDFLHIIHLVNENIGKNAFKNHSKGRFSNKFHPTIFDSITAAYWFALKSGKEIRKTNDDDHIKMLQNPEYQSAISERTTDIENIKKRIQIAYTHLVG